MTALMVLTMAIGIAAYMTAGTIFYSLEGEPLPGISNHLYVVTMDARQAENESKAAPGYSEPDSLLNLRDAEALIDARRAGEQAALAHSYTAISSPEEKRSEDVNGFLVYGPVLQLLGVPLRFGRSWTAAEQAEHAPVVVIDSQVAEKLFGIADAVGRSVELGGHRFRVIGVTAPWMSRTAFIDAGPNGGPGEEIELFVPAGAALDAGVGPQFSGECGNSAANIMFGSTELQHCRWLEVWVSLDSSAAVSSYQRFLTNYGQAQFDAGRFIHPPQAKLFRARKWMTLKHMIPDDVALNAFLAGAFLVLCMVNVSGLLTARFLRRQADVAIRRALGASWREVFVQHLVESALLGLLGAAQALPLSWLGMWIVRKQPVAYASAAHFSGGAFIALLVLSVLVGMAVGILPSWRVCRLPPVTQIKQAT